MAVNERSENVDEGGFEAIAASENKNDPRNEPSTMQLNNELISLSVPSPSTMDNGAATLNCSFTTHHRGKILKNIIQSLVPTSFPDENLVAPTPSARRAERSCDTINPAVVPVRRGKTLRFQNQSACVSPGNRANSPPKYSARSITVTPHELEAVEGLTHLNLSSTANRDPGKGKDKNKNKSKKKVAGGSINQTYFPIAVHELVTETAKNHPDVIDWVANGEAFIIKVTRGKKFERILKKHFRHGKSTSLQRQLNMYGWSKWQIGKYKGAFHHPLFHRDIASTDELTAILRKAPPPSRKRSASKSSLRRIILAKGKRSSPSSDSSEDDQMDPDEVTNYEMQQVVTISGRTRVTPVRYTDGQHAKVTLKSRVASRSDDISTDVPEHAGFNDYPVPTRDNTKPSSKGQSNRDLNTIAMIDSPQKSRIVKSGKHPNDYQPSKQGLKKTPRSMKLWTISANAPEEYIPHILTPKATTPSKFFADIISYNESAETGSEYWGYDPVNTVSCPSWSPFIDDEQVSVARQTIPLPQIGGTPGSVRMTLFHETPSFPSPFVMSPGPRHYGGTFSTAASSASLSRHTSGCSISGCTPMPLPLLRKQSSSVYVQELMGYIPAIQAALGVKQPASGETLVAGVAVDGPTDQSNERVTSSSPTHSCFSFRSPATPQIHLLDSISDVGDARE